MPPLDAVWVWENHIKTTVPYEEDEEAIRDDAERVDDFNEALVNMVTYFELTYLGRPRTDGPRRKPRFPIPTWSINVSVLEETEFSANCSESWNSVSKLTVVSKPSLWQLLIQLKAEDASMKAKMMAITTGAW